MPRGCDESSLVELSVYSLLVWPTEDFIPKLKPLMSLTRFPNLEAPFEAIVSVLYLAVVDYLISKKTYFYSGRTYDGTLSLVALSKPPDVASGH